MKTQAQLLIALSLFACFVAAAPTCSILNNEKDLCQAANTLCTWTDVATSNYCKDVCPLAPKVNTDCTAITGCAFIDSTCKVTDNCTAQTTSGKCTAASNCAFTAKQCTANPDANMNCNDATGACLTTLPAYCNAASTPSCIPSAAPTGQCPQGNTTSGQCTTAPCTTETPVTTCSVSVCAALTTSATCGGNATQCSWDGTKCNLLATLTACSTVASADCAANTQCVSSTVYNCSSANLNTFCKPATAGSACAGTQPAWCSTINTCSVNTNYCQLGQDSCTKDTTNCSTTGTCAILDANACALSVANPTCNTNFCTGKYAYCATSAATGCQVNGAAGCTPADASCQFMAGGTCAAGSSSTNGYMVAFCASILAFIFAL